MPSGSSPSPLLIGDGWSPDQTGGLSRYVTDLFGALAADGAPPPAAVVLGPVQHPPDRCSVPADLDDPLASRLLRVARAVRSRSTDDTVIDSHFGLNGLLPATVGTTRRLPLVTHFHGPWADESVGQDLRHRWSLRIRAGIERAVYSRSHTVITLSTAFRRLAVERYRVDPWRLQVVPPGVDLERFHPGDRGTARRRLGLGEATPLVVSVRRLVPRMGLDDLVRAAAAVPDLRVTIVGEGPAQADLEALIAELGIDDRVALAGQVADDVLVEHYRAADASVIPTRSMEGFGLVALESLASGTPVIASDCGGLREALRGLPGPGPYPAGDVDALTDRLARVAADPGSLPDAEACRAHAEAHGWEAVAAAHRRIYRRAATGAQEERLRVAYLDHTGAPSGAELALLRLLPALTDRVAAHVILGDDGPFLDLLEGQGTSVELLPIGGGASTLRRASLDRLPLGAAAAFGSYTVRLAAHLRRIRPDLVHTNSLKAALVGGVAGRLAGVPVIWHVHDRITSDYLPQRAAEAFRAAARHLPAAVITNSETTRATLGDLTVPTRTIACALDPALGPIDRSGRTDSGLRFGLVARLARWKGQDVFLRAFAEAFPAGPHRAVLVGGDLFGEDDWAQHIEDLIRELGLDDRVERRGHRGDMGPEYERLDVLVHASTLPEPFGQVVTEGLATGLPVVAADDGGPAEILGGRDLALTYPRGDHQALAAQLRRVADDPALRARLAAAGPEAARPYAAGAIADQVLGVYELVLAGGPG